MRRLVIFALLAAAGVARTAAAQTNALADVAARGDPQQVEAMVLSGNAGDIDGLDATSGRTALDYAASYGNDSLAQFLLAHGAGVDARDSSGNTALAWAAQRGKLDVMRTLVAAKAEVDAENRQGQTALMLAASQGEAAAVRLLVADGADPKRQDYTGRDAAAWAAGNNVVLDALSEHR